jgi:diacylglycerol kinase
MCKKTWFFTEAGYVPRGLSHQRITKQNTQHRLFQTVSSIPWSFLITKKCHEKMILKHITLWLFNIAMENGPFIDGLPIKNNDFPWLC